MRGTNLSQITPSLGDLLSLTSLSYPAPFPPATFFFPFTGRRGREPASCEGLCGRGAGADGGGGGDGYGSLRPGWPVARGQGAPAEDDGEDVRGVLKRRVETRQHTEEAVRQQEVEQLDFRDLLGMPNALRIARHLHSEPWELCIALSAHNADRESPR